MNIRNIMLECRNESGLTLAKVASKSGLSATRISNYETGYRMPNADDFFRLVDAMGFEVRIEKKDDFRPYDEYEYVEDDI